jgi:hypothetical protein
MNKDFEDEKNRLEELLQLGSMYVEGGCDGLCLDCDDTMTCEALRKIMQWQETTGDPGRPDAV